MYHVLFLYFLWLSAAGALKISFPPSGTPTAALDSQTITWTRESGDPPDQFFIQKIKLDDGDGPSAKSTPVPINNSQGKSGTSPFQFNRAGLFQILAVDVQNEQTFFSTEITVAHNPTSSLSPTPSSTSTSSKSKDGSSDGDFGGSQPPNMKNMNTDGNGGENATTTPHSSSSTITSPQTSSTEAASTTSGVLSDSKHTAAIIGGVVGSVAVLFIIGATLLCLRYRTRRDTSMFVQAKMGRYRGSDLLSGQWTESSGLEKSDLEQYPSLSPLRRNSLRPQDSVSNVYYAKPILPPIPAARSVASSDVVSSVSSSSSARRLRDRNTSRLSVSTLSTSTSTSGSLFPVPSLPPRTRTDRQMLIEENIQQLQARMLFLQGHSGETSPISRLESEQELTEIHARVDMLKKVHESKWALNLTDEAPEGLF